jgi:hypothetical protein
VSEGVGVFLGVRVGMGVGLGVGNTVRLRGGVTIPD